MKLGPTVTAARKNAGRALLLLLILSVCGSLHHRRCHSGVIGQDEGVLLTYPAMILSGYVPYRDFAAIYPPGSYYVIAAAFKLFGVHFLVERGVGAVYWLAITSGAFLLGCVFSVWLAIGAALSTVLLLSQLEAGAYAMLAAQSLGLMALLSVTLAGQANRASIEEKWLFVSGLLSGFTVWFRQDAGLVVTLSTAIVTLVHLRPNFKCFLAGITIPITALLLLFNWIGLDYAFESLVLDPIRNSPGRKLPIEVSALVMYLLACALISIFTLRSTRIASAREKQVFLLASGLFSFGMVPSALQRPDVWHLVYVTVSVAGLCLIRLGIVLNPTSRPVRSALLTLVFLSVLIWVVNPSEVVRAWKSPEKDIPHITNGNRVLYANDHLSAKCSNALISEIKASAQIGSRIFIGPQDLRFTNYNEVYMYFLLGEYAPASRHLEMNPGIGNRVGSTLSNDIRTADLLALTTRYETWSEPNASMVAGPDDPNRIIAQEFCALKTICDWTLLKKCRKSASQ